jgi:putative ABC transport system permease protein
MASLPSTQTQNCAITCSRFFDQTFAVTSVLRSVAIVSIAGVLFSLSTLVLEREREIGVLRSQGASPGQIRHLVLTEASMVSLLSSLVGILCSTTMAMILTWVAIRNC